MKIIDEEREKEDIKRRQHLILGIVAVVVAGVGLFGWWQKTSVGETRVLLRQPEQQTSIPKGPVEIFVYVSGMVKHPGVIKLSPGARVIDAVNAAGGLLPEADVGKVNLAQPLKDGMQVNVPGSVVVRPAVTSSHTVRTQETRQTVNINTADKAELEKLPGIGPALAERIIEARNTKGPFRDGADLKKVPGIGEAKFAKIKDSITW